ncbi:MAG: MFS transporter [Pirellulales bacterium]|nr:MFS transporter [Pirellulales bacterium]
MNPRTGTVYALLVLLAINTMNFYDRLVLTPLSEPIRKHWELSDTALGWLGTAFTLIYAVVGLPLGRLADLTNRKRILVVGVFLWSLLTGISGICVQYWQLFLARLGVGVGEATCAPAASSLIGDYFSAAARARAMSVFMMGLPLGNALAVVVGGIIAERIDWRAALYVAFIPGVLCALAATWIVEPQRGASESHAVGLRRRPGSPFLLVLSIPTMWWIIASGALHNFNMYALGAFMHAFLVRVHGLNLEHAGYVMAAVYGLAGIPGLLIGGWLGDHIVRRRVSGRLFVAALALGAATPLVFLALEVPAGGVAAFVTLMGAGCGLMYVYYATVYSTIQDVIEPALRGTAMALYFCAMYVLGASLGPLATGMASDYFARAAAAAKGVSLEGLKGPALEAALAPFKGQGLHQAMYIIPVLCLVLAFVLFAGARTVTNDVARLRLWMEQSSRDEEAEVEAA